MKENVRVVTCVCVCMCCDNGTEGIFERCNNGILYGNKYVFLCVYKNIVNKDK